MQRAILALENGAVYRGRALGAQGTTFGEIVFNTSMTGYQEILTDPSYRGQIVAMTYPEIGNYGFNDEDAESRRPFLSGFVVRNASPIASNFRSQGTLGAYLAGQGVVGICDIDTRALVRSIRTEGAMKAGITTEYLDENEFLEQVRRSPGLVGRDLVREVLPEQPIEWRESLESNWHLAGNGGSDSIDAPHLIALDFGMKWNIGRHLVDQGFRVTILPGTSSATEVMAYRPDGLFLSNGPGDPAPLQYAIDTIRELLGKLPIFGICLGHQLLALACGAQTFKLKFGHRGANQPVINLHTQKIEITSQNHGFSVCEETLPSCLEITHRNLNDNTVAGLRHRQFPAFSVQYHPEASAGPHDSHYLFDEFRQMVTNHSMVAG
ncbi:MAG TPA: glutamine-hydrolyzing carbamoyl-phosphate synthase small subunit [Pirellulaceae bacterium]|nr:glutamine-hydrolyzing carbamoyl-phosphate synthase small subunit [Pirellulaceae bacterium]